MRNNEVPRLAALITLILGTCVVGNLRAQEHSVENLLEKVAALEARVNELEDDKALAPANLLETEINALAGGTAYRSGDMSTRWSNTTRHTSDDKAFDIKIGGRIQTDFVFGTQDDSFEDSYGQVGNYVEFRRARIFISGTIYSNVFFKAQYDFARTGNAVWKDVFIGLKKVPVVGNIVVGQFKIPMSLEHITSSKYIGFLERALPVEAFAPGRQTGFLLTDTAMEDDRLFWAVSVYRASGPFGNATSDAALFDHDGAWEFATRVAFVAWEDEGGKKLLEIGASFNYRNPSQGLVLLRSRPEIHTPQRRILGTDNGPGGLTDVDNLLVFQFEVALVLESFSAQSEFFYVSVDDNSSGDPAFWGFYLQLSYFLTGEHRPYKKSAAAFNRIKPLANYGDEGSGAWELLARVSYLDLDDESITGGTAWNLTAGVTWYLNPNTQVKFNYVYSDADDGIADGTSHWFGFRFQIDF